MAHRVHDLPLLPPATLAVRSPDDVRQAFHRMRINPPATTVARVVVGYEPVVQAAAAQEGALSGSPRSIPLADGEASRQLLRHLGLVTTSAASFVSHWVEARLDPASSGALLSYLAA